MLSQIGTSQASLLRELEDRVKNISLEVVVVGEVKRADMIYVNILYQGIDTKLKGVPMK
jgi:hypothetical protein